VNKSLGESQKCEETLNTFRYIALSGPTAKVERTLAIVTHLIGIKEIVEAAAIAAGSNAPRYVVSFPGMVQRRRFLDAMARIVPDLPRAGEPH
jgi:hypothetical protein